MPATGPESLYDRIASLTATNDAQRGLQSQASGLLMGIARTRFLLFAQSGSSISTALLVIVVFWLSVNFASFGLFARRNTTMTTALLLCALSVAGAIFLILEMDRPFEGILRISDAPLREVLTLLGR